MYTIDTNVFYLSCRKLITCIQTKQVGVYANPAKVAFDYGWFKDQEWYKRKVWKAAQNILQYNSWKQELIHTYDLTARVAKCIDIKIEGGGKQNLITWREAADKGPNSLKRLLFESKEASEKAIYQIFCGEDEEQAFKTALSVWGAKYPFLSFLFFLKDMENYVPVRPRIMGPRFEQLGIKTDCLRVCSWENYKEFVQILKQVQELLKGEIPSPELIDAHSFMWAMWVLEKAEATSNTSLTGIREKEEQRTIIGDCRESVVKVRINQNEFRKRLLKRYNGCCLCGLSNPELLIASHIQPWSLSDKEQKVDVDNGLLLCPNHDQLFDKGFITFSDDGEMIISKKLSSKDRVLMNVQTAKRITLSERGKEYMQFHRKKIFRSANK